MIGQSSATEKSKLSSRKVCFLPLSLISQPEVSTVVLCDDRARNPGTSSVIEQGRRPVSEREREEGRETGRDF